MLMNMKPYWLRSKNIANNAARQSIPSFTTAPEFSFLNSFPSLQNSRPQSQPTLNAILRDADNLRRDGLREDTILDITQIPGPSRVTPCESVPNFFDIHFGSLSPAFTLPFLALPPLHHDPNLYRRSYKCAICDETATGKHYGAPSCFGCKSFWRRSISCQRKYRCKFDGACELKKVRHQNLCRACRLQKCFEVGMKPEAIQSEREQSVSQDFDTSDYARSLSPLTKQPSYIRSVDQLIQHHYEVCNKIDEPTSTATTTNVSAEAMEETLSTGIIESINVSVQMKTVDYEKGFYNPHLISLRTPIKPIGSHPATVEDIINDSKRCFVLYSDWLTPLAEFQELSKKDQINLSKRRFPIFHWWICSLWTIMANKNEFCYSNGSYFPLEANAQCIHDSYNMIDKMFKMYVEPSRALDLNIAESCLLFAIAFFKPEPTLSTFGQQHIKKCHDSFQKLLYSLILEEKKSTIRLRDGELEHQAYFETSKRIGEIMGLISTLHTCTILNQNNEGSLPDVLHVTS